MSSFAILDAARDYMRIGMARRVSPAYANLFIGEKGQRLDHVAPHCFTCDANGLIEHMTLSGQKPDEAGILGATEAAFPDVYKHFRRFLTVLRERDRKRVLFRFYDPRVLRAFLPACTAAELAQFFGPIVSFHCQGDDPGVVLRFTRNEKGRLLVEESTFDDYFEQRFGIRPSSIKPIPSPLRPPQNLLPVHRQHAMVYRSTDWARKPFE